MVFRYRCLMSDESLVQQIAVDLEQLKSKIARLIIYQFQITVVSLKRFINFCNKRSQISTEFKLNEDPLRC
jgi:hypothetical protein